MIESISDALLGCKHLRLLMSLSSSFLPHTLFLPSLLTTVTHNLITRIPKRIRRWRLMEELVCESRHSRAFFALSHPFPDSGPQRDRDHPHDHPPTHPPESAQLFVNEPFSFHHLPCSSICVSSARKSPQEYPTRSVPAPSAFSLAVFVESFHSLANLLFSPSQCLAQCLKTISLNSLTRLGPPATSRAWTARETRSA